VAVVSRSRTRPRPGRAVRAVRLAAAAVAVLLPVTVAVATEPAPPDGPTTRTSVAGWRAPVPGAVAAPADLPAQRWLPGHRGVDLASTAGEPVVSPAAGTVTFAGPVAGRPLVVVTHGELRSTLEPVDATVVVGTVVAAGQVVGTTGAVGSHCGPAVCLHWGVRRGETYLDPLTLLGRSAPIVLLPLG
jgi:murein DD-endopeptidase MepM/ murein hydrolase activator NlpD